MRTKAAIILLVAVGCAGEPEEPGVIYAGDCPKLGCGTNSQEILRNGMHEANLFGVPDKNGMSLETSKPSGTNSGRQRAQIWDSAGHAFDLHVENGQLFGVDPQTNAVLEHGSLAGSSIHVLRNGSRLWDIRIDGVHDVKAWVKPYPWLEVYKMVWIDRTTMEEGEPCDLPDHPFDKWEDRFELLGMDATDSLVYEGDRYRIEGRTMSKNNEWDPEWFNFGCAGRTIAKMRLLRKTQGNGTGNWKARQAALKMLSADYCRNGEPFTRTGTHIGWKDAEGLVNYVADPLQLEARWDEGGATCVDKPRLEATRPWIWDYIVNSCPDHLPVPCTIDQFDHQDPHDLAGNQIVSGRYD